MHIDGVERYVRGVEGGGVEEDDGVYEVEGFQCEKDRSLHDLTPPPNVDCKRGVVPA